MQPAHALATAFLIQVQQMLPLTVLGLFLAPSFLMRGKRMPTAQPAVAAQAAGD